MDMPDPHMSAAERVQSAKAHLDVIDLQEVQNEDLTTFLGEIWELEQYARRMRQALLNRAMNLARNRRTL